MGARTIVFVYDHVEQTALNFFQQESFPHLMSSLEHKILNTLGAPDYHSVTGAALAKELEITKKRLAEFRGVLDELLASGQVQQNSSGLLRVPASAGLIQGMIKKTSGGFGFLIPHSKKLNAAQQDIYIGRHDMADAHTGDEVVVKLLKQAPRADGKLRGKVVDVITRSTRTFVGVYLERDAQGWVQVDGTTLNEPIFVGDPGAKGAQPGDKVVLEMLRFPSPFRSGEGVLTRVLGPRGSVGVDTLSIIHEFGLPDEFPEDFLEEARVQAEKFDERDLAGRRDLTEETIITIDPADARDFDDAISLEQTENGHWNLGVHIADVAHFVRPGSALDKEAYKRGTSVYLPDRVLPMLPEIISNGLASLQQGHVRYTKSVFMEFSREGMPVHAEFANSAIKVTHRFAYEEVMPIVENPEKFRNKVSGKVRKLLARMYELAMLLRARRFAQGMLELTMPEVKIDFDKEGKVSGAHVAPHDPSHEVIEEFMLAANMAVATALNDKGIPFLRRAHGDPDEAKLRALGEFVTALGYPLKRFQSRPELQKLLERVKGTPHMHAVNYALLRSMKQAEYTGEPLGHYALAADHYCHFTSPIRRYPDLTVHRLIGELVAKGKVVRYPSELELVTSGQHCSATERRAAQAERELIKVKLLTYMAGRIGDEFEAIITGVQDFGFFCQVVDVPAEGLVHISTLDDDHYDFDAASQTLVGRGSGHQHRLGDRLRVVAAHADIDRRQLDFRVAGSHSASRVRKPDGSTARTASPNSSGPKRHPRGQHEGEKKRHAEKPKSRPKKRRR